MKRMCFAVVIFFLTIGSASSEPIVVIDGDTLRIEGDRHRLFGKFISWFNLIRQ